MSVAPSSTIEQHTYSNGLVLVAETMPSVQSAAFSLLLPAGAAYESADGLNLNGGAATMAAEWITRGAGSRDSRELLTALDNLGVSHAESAQTLHTSLAGATLGRNLEPALEIFADMVLRPHLDDDEVEPIRALCLQNLRSLEDDPGTKVIYELRRRHFPDPWGTALARDDEGVVVAHRPSDLRRFLAAIVPAERGDSGRRRRDRLAEASRRQSAGCSATGRPQPAPRVAERPAGPRRDHIVRETQQIQIALAYPAATVASPDYYRARAADGDPGRLFLGPALHRGPRETRSMLLGLRCLREPARARGHALLCRHLHRAGPGNPRRHARRGRPARHLDGVALEELETMRAGLKSSLIMAQESSMSRSGSLASDWFFLGRVRPIEEIAAELDALTPESVSDYAATFQSHGEPTIVTLGPTALRLPP